MQSKKTMEIKMGVNIHPQVRCEIWMHTTADGQENGDDKYVKIFSNVQNMIFIASDVSLSDSLNTLTLSNDFRGGIGAGFKLKVFNYTTAQIYVASQGEGVSLSAMICDAYNPSLEAPNEILSINTVSNKVSIVFDTEFYQVSFNDSSYSFDNTDTTIAKFNNNYYIGINQQQLAGKIINELTTEIPYDFIDSIDIGDNNYNSTTIQSWNNNNCLVIPRNIEIDGAITINTKYLPITYLELTGTQYINTGFKLNNNSKVEVDFDILTLQSDFRGLIGSRNDSDTYKNGYIFFTSTANTVPFYRLDYYNSPAQSVQGTQLSIGNHKVVKDKEKNYIDGVQIASNETSTFTCDYDAYLGAIHNSEGAGWKFIGRINYCKIWDNGTLIRDFIPVLKTNDNTLGMYDLVNGVFYGNAGSGKFENYKTLDYLEYQGTQYINTNFMPTSNTKVEINFDIATLNFGSYQTLFGARTSMSEKAYVILTHLYTEFFTFDYCLTTQSRINTCLVTVGNHTIIKDKEKNYVDGVQYTSNETSTFECLYPAYLGALNTMGTSGEYFFGKIYYCKIWDNGALIKNLIPVLRLSDNTPGMYDTLTRVLYTNAGTGSFLYN